MKFVPLREATGVLGLCRSTIRNMVADGRIPSRYVLRPPSTCPKRRPLLIEVEGLVRHWQSLGRPGRPRTGLPAESPQEARS